MMENRLEKGFQGAKESTEVQPKSIRDYLRYYGLELDLPEIKICVTEGVYPPKYDSLLLAKQAVEVVKSGDKVLDLGTGSGVLAVLVAVKGGIVVATDVDRRSIECAAHNAHLNNVVIDTRIGDLFEPVTGELFDIIVTNIPSLPTPAKEQPEGYVTRNFDAGCYGRKYLDPLIAQACDYLKPGYLLLVHSHLANSDKTRGDLRNLGFEVEIQSCELAIGVNQFGLVSGQRIPYFLKNLPPNCHPIRKKEHWYQRMDVFRAFLK